MRRFGMGAVLLAALAGCAATPAQQAAALAPSAATLAARSVESRRFDTHDTTMMLQSAVGALQDLDFTIEETQPQFGVVVASKQAGAEIRAQVVVRPVPGAGGIIVRATFQRVLPSVGALPPHGELLTDPVLYRGFFEKLAQSAFLTAHSL